MRQVPPAAAGRILALATGLVLACAPIAHGASAEVAALQVALRAKGLYRSAVDGVSGPVTVRATRTLQRRARIGVDGIPGARTRTALGRRGRPALGSRPMVAGRSGWDVAALQFLLRARGYDPGPVDGGFGPATRSAVRAFQRTVGLTADSVAGPRTVSALRTRVVTARASDPVRFLRPLGGAWTDGFGWLGTRRHTGLDFPRPTGSPVGAAGRGVVSFAGFNAFGYGNLVVVRHRLGYESWYAHLASIGVRPGQSVAGGSVLGTVGSTGRSSGPHLHFEVRRYGTPVNPVSRLLTAVSAAREAAASRPRERPGSARPGARRLTCRPNADARRSRDADPGRARPDRCP